MRSSGSVPRAAIRSGAGGAGSDERGSPLAGCRIGEHGESVLARGAEPAMSATERPREELGCRERECGL